METYYQDESGTWWCHTKRQRVRATLQECRKCGKHFPNRHTQQFCSYQCRADSQKGIPRVDRPPRPCDECGIEYRPAMARTKRYRSRFCSRECGIKNGNKRRGRKGPLNKKWKGGIKHHKAGYVMKYDLVRRVMMLEHRLVMEHVIGRPLERFEEVHHKNGIRHDNRPENLELWAKRQPGGQRVKDLIEYARWVLATYGPVEHKL